MKTNVYRVLKLFSSLNEGGTYDQNIKDLFWKGINLLELVDPEKVTSFELNYGTKKIESLRSIKNYFFKNPNYNISFINGYSKIDNTSILIQNFGENNDRPDAFAYLEIAIKTNLFEFELIKKTVQDWSMDICFQYGYVVDLDFSFNFFTEKKIKKTFWGSSLDIGGDEHFLGLKMSRIFRGEILGIYPINIINHSQYSSISKLKTYGLIEKIGESLWWWELQDEIQLNQAKNNLRLLS